MKHLSCRLSAVFAVALLFCSCAAHQVPFNEADFTRSLGTGTGVMTGQVIRLGASGSQWVHNKPSRVKLFPANAYTDEIARRKYNDREWLSKPDPRFAKYVRRTLTDNSGHFTFRHLPPGDYYVACRLKWDYVYDSEDDQGFAEKVEASTDQWLWVRDYVKNGEITTITSWNQGK